MKCTNVKPELKSAHGSDEFISTDSDWDSHFPALTMKTHNTFTLASGKVCDKKDIQEGSQKSGGDTYLKVKLNFSYKVNSDSIMVLIIIDLVLFIVCSLHFMYLSLPDLLFIIFM